MIANKVRGSIINIASISGKLPELNGNAYSPSKAGVISLSALLAVEWARYGIRVNALSPGPVMTPLQKKNLFTLKSFHLCRIFELFADGH